MIGFCMLRNICVKKTSSLCFIQIGAMICLEIISSKKQLVFEGFLHALFQIKPVQNLTVIKAFLLGDGAVSLYFVDF